MVWVVVGLVAVPSCLLLDFGCGSRAVSLLAPPCWEWGGKIEGGGGPREKIKFSWEYRNLKNRAGEKLRKHG